LYILDLSSSEELILAHLPTFNNITIINSVKDVFLIFCMDLYVIQFGCGSGKSTEMGLQDCGSY
jgi:Tfp pilus assembly ATPase PilU